METKLKAILGTALFVLSAVIIPIQSSDISAGDGFSVTDGEGNTVTYSAPTDKVITVGKGMTGTVIDLRYLNKIAATDRYAKESSEDVFSEIKQRSDIHGIGSLYAIGDLYNNILRAVEDEKFDKEKDTILIAGTSGSLDKLLNDLSSDGFKRILVWRTIGTYADLIDFVDSVSMVLSGGVSEKAEQMRYVEKHIKDTLRSKDVKARNAFYITHSGGNFKVGNTGSLATSMITAAGGNAVTVDDAKDKPTYAENNPARFIQEHGQDTVVFVDDTIVSDATKLANLKSNLPGITLVPLESMWNNFYTGSMEGVWAMACAMYPEHFEGDVPTIPDSAPDYLLYAGAAAVAIVAICIIGFYFLRRS